MDCFFSGSSVFSSLYAENFFSLSLSLDSQFSLSGFFCIHDLNHCPCKFFNIMDIGYTSSSISFRICIIFIYTFYIFPGFSLKIFTFDIILIFMLFTLIIV